MGSDLFELLLKEKQKQELAALLSVNEKTEQFGLCLTETDAKALITCRNKTLKKYQRAEFGEGILDRLIFTFCDSQYISQDNYRSTLERLQDIFYEFKHEAQELLTDDELMTFMREQYEGVCYGDLDYLEGTCLEAFARAIRAGYQGYQSSSGQGEYAKFDQNVRWDPELYLTALQELF